MCMCIVVRITQPYRIFLRACWPSRLKDCFLQWKVIDGPAHLSALTHLHLSFPTHFRIAIVIFDTSHYLGLSII